MTFKSLGQGIFLIGALLILLPACSRMVPVPIQEKARPYQPPDAALIEPGDILLTFSHDPTSWLLSLMGSPDPDRLKNPYTHGEMAFANLEGEKMLGGFSGSVMAQSLEERLPIFHKLVVLRAKNPELDDGRLGAKMAQVSLTAEYRKASFDYAFRDVPGRTDKFYCLGLINEVYRQIDEPVPFPHRPIPNNLLLAHIEELLGQSITDGPVIEEVFRSDAYEVVMTWDNNRFQRTDTWLNEHVARLAFDLYRQGWRLKASNDLSVSLLLWFADDDSLADLQRVVHSFEGFYSEVRIDWQKAKVRGDLEGLSDVQKRSHLHMLASRHIPTYFYPHASNTRLISKTP